MATSSWRAIGGKCRALMMAAKSSTTATATTTTTAPPPKAPKPAKRPSPNAAPRGILKAVPVSSQLSEFVGASEASRTEAVKKVWDYIKLHQLQNPSNKKEIICDEKLKTLFGKDKVGFLEIARLLSQHFVKTG